MEATTIASTPLTLSEELRKAFYERNILTTRSKMKVLSALNEFTKTSKMQKGKELKEKAINEIYTSEITYLKQLELIMKYFMEPLRTKNWLPQSTFHALFGNLEILYKVNGELLQELKQQNGNVGAAFTQLAPYLKLYSVYAYDYKQAFQMLQELLKSNKELREFISIREKLPEVSTSFQSLLIVPIQRIPRYKLLLQEVLNHTQCDDPEYCIIQGALKKVEETALHINDHVNQCEILESMIALAKRLSDCPINIVEPGRKIIKQGSLMKASKNGRTAHSRYLVLFNDSLMYCKGGEEGPLKFCGFLPVKHCHVEPVLSTGVFKIICQGEMLLLYTSNSKVGQEWITALQAATKEHQECRKTLRKESSKRRPVRRNVRVGESSNQVFPQMTKSEPSGCFGRLRFLR
ncbi:hypothetical protein RUM43_007424 [Polyplax serrata]|uniref:Uncharacterized protein n=1 Tax=Polyplax serrata TaxID=468196 RepID=A0AAN8S8N9_POLSC